MTKNDHFKSQKCHFSAFLAFFKISFFSLQHPIYIAKCSCVIRLIDKFMGPFLEGVNIRYMLVFTY